MDNRKFDALTRSFAEGISRRNVLKGLFGGAVAVAGSAVAGKNIAAQVCLDPPDDICTGGNGDNPDGCSCNSGAGTCIGGWCCARPCGETCCGGNSDCQTCNTDTGTCELVNQDGPCNGGAGVCDGEWCVDPPTDTCPSPDGACLNGGGDIPDDCPCNGGAGVCAGGWCCDPTRLCGESCCSGNPDCEICDAGVCTPVNQSGSCNGGAGVCDGVWCVDPPTTTADPCPVSCGTECCDSETEKCCGNFCIQLDQCCPLNPADCPDPCTYCEQGTCEPVCELGSTCCEDDEGIYCSYIWDDRDNCGACGHECESCEICVNGYCMETNECCGVFGDSCGYYLNEVFILADETSDSDQLSCCDGLVCCNPEILEITLAGGEVGSYCAECCSDWDCPKGHHCKSGRCRRRHHKHCKHDKHCPDDTCCCGDGKCSKHCCHDHKKPQKPGDPEVETLPSTGSGDTASGSGWLGAAALGAAAIAVGKTLRDGAAPVPEATSEE